MFYHFNANNLLRINSLIANLWNMNLWSPTVHVFKSAEFPLWKHRKTTHPCRQVSHLRDPLVEIQDEGAYLLIPLWRPWWFVSMKKKRNSMGFWKVKLRSELIVELLDVAGVVVLGRSVKVTSVKTSRNTWTDMDQRHDWHDWHVSTRATKEEDLPWIT